MRKKYLLSLGLMLSAMPVAASDDANKRTVRIVSMNNVPEDMTGGALVTRIQKHFKAIALNGSELIKVSKKEAPQMAALILKEYQAYSKIINQIADISKSSDYNAFGFGYKHVRQVYFATCLAYLQILKNEDHPISDEEVRRSKEIRSTCIEHCRNYFNPERVPLTQLIKAEDALVDPEKSQCIQYVLAEMLSAVAVLSRGEVKLQYDYFIESAKLYDSMSMYGDAYVAYFNANEMLKVYPGVIENKAKLFNFFRGKLKHLWSYLPKEERSSAMKAYTMHEEIERMPSNVGKHEKIKTQRIMRSQYEQVAEQFESSAEDLKKRGGVAHYIYNIKAAAQAYSNAAVYSRVSDHKQRLYLKTVDCAREFEASAAKVLMPEAGFDLNDPKTLFDFYRRYYTSNLDICVVAQNYVEMLQFIKAFFYLGEFEQAKLRCDVLLQLEGKPVRATLEGEMLRVLINAAMGDVAEMQEVVAVVKSASQKKRDRKKQSQISKIQQHQEEKKAAEAVKAEAAAAVVVEPKAPAVYNAKEEAADDSERMPFVSTTHLSQGHVENLKNEYRKADLGKKSEAATPAVAPVSAPKVTPVVKVVKKPLSPKVYKLCTALLNGGQECKSISRTDILKLFGDLGCVIDESRGKGSHGLIMVRNKENNQVVGGIPFLEEIIQNPHDDEAEAAPSNASLPMPQWEGPPPFYIIKATQNLLHKLGYTLDSIEVEKTVKVRQKRE